MTRAPFPEAGAALRLAASSACAAHLSTRQYRTLLAVLALTASWSRVEDDLSLGQIAQVHFGVEHTERWQRRKVREDLVALEARGIITMAASGTGRPRAGAFHTYRIDLKRAPTLGSVPPETHPDPGAPFDSETHPDPGARSDETCPGIGNETCPGISNETCPGIRDPSEKGSRGGAEEAPPPPTVDQVTHRAVALLHRPTTPEDRRSITAWISTHGIEPSTAALDALEGRGFDWWSQLRPALDAAVPPRRRTDVPTPAALDSARNHGAQVGALIDDADLPDLLASEYPADDDRRAAFLAGRAAARSGAAA